MEKIIIVSVVIIRHLISWNILSKKLIHSTITWDILENSLKL